jgi:nucleoid-associated protein YgaU
MLILLVVGLSVSAQSLLDDPVYSGLLDEVEQLRNDAQTAIDEGRYEEAVDLANQAEAKAEEAEAYAQEAILRYRANSWVNTIAPERLAYARSINAPERYPDEWEAASSLMEQAETAFDEERWYDAVDAARRVVRNLENVRPASLSNQEPEPEPTNTEPAPDPDPEQTLPATYIVRRIPERRDSFWRIAGYEFVYGDPWQWRRLYEANRDLIPDPDNPDLILPGMEMVIPAREGESREGIWNPEDRIEEEE